MSLEDLRRSVLDCCSAVEVDRREAREVVDRLLTALEQGTVRAAEPDGDRWQVHEWVKQGILLGFRIGGRAEESTGAFHFADRDTFPTRPPGDGVRIVPGGSTVRRGAHLGNGVVIMPPAYVNVGAFVGAGSMVDSHALVGSCAQVGAGVHLSAAAQIGGVLEPVGALPVIVEDDAFIGGGCSVFEGARICKGAVLAAGVVITRAVALYDLVRETVHRAGDDGTLHVPAGAVVVPGSRTARGSFAAEHGLQLQTPVIVKYRDRGTDAALALEEALR